MNFFVGNNRVLRTRLSPEECRERLRESAMTTFRPGTWFSAGRPVVGRVSGQSFTLRKRISYINSFQTIASGRFVPGPPGTRVEVSLGCSVWVLGFMLFWFCGVGFFALVGLLMLLARGFDPEGLVALLVPLGMVAVGVAVGAFSRWLARDEGAFLLRFLRETLAAEEETGGPLP